MKACKVSKKHIILMNKMSLNPKSKDGHEQQDLWKKNLVKYYRALHQINRQDSKKPESPKRSQ